jgi:hypothetical protein
MHGPTRGRGTHLYVLNQLDTVVVVVEAEVAREEAVHVRNVLAGTLKKLGILNLRYCRDQTVPSVPSYVSFPSARGHRKGLAMSPHRKINERNRVEIALFFASQACAKANSS